MQQPPTLDAAIARGAAGVGRRGAGRPQALLLLATGTGGLPGRLEGARRLPLGELDGCPPSWSASHLHHGSFHGLPVWMLEERPPEALAPEPPWCAGYPVWLAAAAGASTLLVVSAGIGLGDVPRGAIALLRDHVNLSGATPLAGLGESRLGPLFPDQTRLHDGRLRRQARALCAELGLEAVEAVAACGVGPTLETPAELAWFERAGCDVAVQRLAAPLIAAAHAGLAVLGLVAVTARAGDELDLARLSAASGALAPALDDLLWQLAGRVQAEAARALEEPS